MEDVKSLCTYVVENFGKIFDDIEYVQTFKSLKTKYDQHQDRLKDRDKGSLDKYVMFKYYRFITYTVLIKFKLQYLC